MCQLPTVFVVDDDQAVRRSSELLIRAMDINVVCCASAEEFQATYDAGSGCLVLDVRMPGMSGIELQKELVDNGIRLPVILVSGHGTVPMSVAAMKRGAIDFLEKPYQPAHLRDCVRRAIELDSTWRQEEIAKRELRIAMGKLSDQEAAVLRGMIAGKANKEIASGLDISLRTVQFRRASLMKKLRVDSRAALMRLVFSAGQPGLAEDSELG